MKRFITVCVLICFLFAFHSFVYAEGINAADSAKPGDITSANKAVATINDYMDARKELLMTGSTAALSEVAVAGIVSDEIAHCTILENKEIKLLSSTFSISEIDVYDNEISAVILEEVTFESIPIKQNTSHEIVIYYKDGGELIVVSDGYYEVESGFQSASYVSSSDNALLLNSISSTLPIVSVAETQVGYLEKASNSNLDSHTANAGSNDYTKYGKWFGWNPDPWCAMFVSWCADQANICTAIIEPYGGCPRGATLFRNKGVYYNVDSYTPKVGDIFFTGDGTEEKHTGIVVGVTSANIMVIDGNCENQVRSHTIARTDTRLMGYASPNYDAGHSYAWQSDDSYHWKCCSDCGDTLSQFAHTWELVGARYRCNVCGRTSTQVPGIMSCK